MKTGIMGGTFNPIHNAHLALAHQALKDYKLDKIWFLPNGNPPHKENPSQDVTTEQRIEMIKLAIAGEERFELCLYEANRKRISYSYETMETFCSMYPQDQFFFIIGGDSLAALETWRNPSRLLQTCTMLAACRDEVDICQIQKEAKRLNALYSADIRLLMAPPINVSSSDIRKLLRENQKVKGLIPESVLQYIQEEQLYQRGV